MKTTVKRLHCKKCGHRWLPKKEDVRQCPACKTAYWKNPSPYSVGRKRELQYAEFLKSKNIHFVYPSPRIFVLNGKPNSSYGRSYRPDFYLPNENRYIEVVGHRASFFGNREKIEYFRKFYTIDVVRPDGALFIEPLRKAIKILKCP